VVVVLGVLGGIKRGGGGFVGRGKKAKKGKNGKNGVCLKR